MGSRGASTIFAQQPTPDIDPINNKPPTDDNTTAIPSSA